MPESDQTELLVAVARLEEVVNGLKDKVEELERENQELGKTVDDHGKTLTVYKDSKGPRLHWITIASSVAAIVSVAILIIQKIAAGN